MKNGDRNLDKIRQQAQLETTDQNTLCLLANSKRSEIRLCVAANPNTPLDSLRMLGKEFPQIVIQNPVFKKLLKEQPESEFVRISLARISTTPTEKLEQWSGLKNQARSFYFALATNPNNSARGLDLIIDNCPYYDVYNPILCDPKTRASTLEKIVFKKGFVSFRFLRPQHPNITPKLRKIIDFFSGDYYTEPSILFELIERGLGRQKAFAHPNMSAEFLHRLSFIDEIRVKNQVATHPKTQEFTLNKIIQQDPLIAGCHVAIRPDLSEEFALKLAQNNNQEVLQALLLNPQISSQVLKSLLNRSQPPAPNKEARICGNCRGIREPTMIDDRDLLAGRPYGNILDNPIFVRDDITFSSARTKEKFVDHPQVTSEILEKLSKNWYSSVRKRVAQSNKINRQIINRLARDPSCEVRESIAKNPLTPSTILNKLGKNPCRNVRRAAANSNEERKQKIQDAENLVTPTATLGKLLQDPSCPVKARAAIAIRKISPTMILALAQDSSETVRSALAINPLISEQIAANLARDSSSQVIDALLKNSALSVRVFTLIFEQTYQEQAKPRIQEIDICDCCCPSKYYFDPNCPFPVYNPYEPRTYGLYDPLLHGEDPASSHKIERFAKHPLTTIQILQQLKNNKYSAVREAVAISPKLTKKIIDELAQDLSCWVRATIARNTITSKAVLDKLHYDRCFNVRLAVAKNHHTSLPSLRNLLYDQENDITEAAMKNINSPKA